MFLTQYAADIKNKKRKIKNETASYHYVLYLKKTDFPTQSGLVKEVPIFEWQMKTIDLHFKESIVQP
jgi:hypothetical protein